MRSQSTKLDPQLDLLIEQSQSLKSQQAIDINKPNLQKSIGKHKSVQDVRQKKKLKIDDYYSKNQGKI